MTKRKLTDKQKRYLGMKEQEVFELAPRMLKSIIDANTKEEDEFKGEDPNPEDLLPEADWDEPDYFWDD